MPQRGHLQWGGAGGCPSARWGQPHPARRKRGKEGEKQWSGLISCTSRWREGNKQKLFAFLARRASLGRKDGMGREGQAGRLADGQSGGGERVDGAKAAGGAVSGVGWSSRFAQEVCSVCPLPVFPCLSDISCLGCQQLRDSTCPPEAALCLTGGQRSCNGKAEALAERRGRKTSGHCEKNCWLLLKRDVTCCLTHQSKLWPQPPTKEIPASLQKHHVTL